MGLGNPWAPVRCQMQGDKERRLRRTNSTPQGEAIAGNTADDILLVDQGNKTLAFYINFGTRLFHAPVAQVDRAPDS